MNINKPLSILAFIGITLYFAILSVSFFRETESIAAETETRALPKTQYAEAAVRHVRSLTPLQSPQTFVTYRTDKHLDGYLQQQNLYEEYVKRYETGYPLEYFTVEVRDDAVRAHYEVDLHYRDGKVIGWRNLNAGPNKTAGPEETGEIAAAYVRRQGYDLSQFDMRKETGLAEQVFFESRDHKIGAAHLRLAVDVRGGEVSGFRSGFVVPDSYLDWQSAQDRIASVLTSISLGTAFAMSLAAIIIMVRYRKTVRFSRGILLSLVYLAIYVANNLNLYPSYKAAEGEYVNGLAAVLLLVFLNFVTLLLAVSLYLSLLSGLVLWRRLGSHPWPHWTEAHFREETLRGMGRGYLLAFFLLGVQQLLFWIGETQFGVWAVRDAANSVHNMFSPALFPLMAWAAAISEEAVYRLFGIALFKKLLRSNFLAVLVPSMIWALGHTQYPIYPVYTRFVEVTVLGIIFGYAFLRYGFITVVFAHAAMNSILMGMSLMFLGTEEAAAGLFYMLSPALAGYLIYLLHSFRRRKDPPILPEANG